MVVWEILRHKDVWPQGVLATRPCSSYSAFKPENRSGHNLMQSWMRLVKLTKRRAPRSVRGLQPRRKLLKTFLYHKSFVPSDFDHGSESTASCRILSRGLASTADRNLLSDFHVFGGVKSGPSDVWVQISLPPPIDCHTWRCCGLWDEGLLRRMQHVGSFLNPGWLALA